jgi:hypothetical protein
MEALKIKVGRDYVTRSGIKVGPLKIANNGTNYKFEASVNEPEHETPSVRAWKENGRFLTDTTDHELDLIAEA